MAVLLITIDRMPFLAPTQNNADSLFESWYWCLMITPGFYLHHVEVADQDPDIGSLWADKIELRNHNLQ